MNTYPMNNPGHQEKAYPG